MDNYFISSFLLPILLFSTAPGIFANCPDLRTHGGNDECIALPRGEVSKGSILFDNAAIFRLNQSGPCQFHQKLHTALVYKVDSEGNQIDVLFSCTYDNGIGVSRKPCQDMGRVRVIFNTEQRGDRNAFNFKLEVLNLQPSDIGLYQYEAAFFKVIDKTSR